MAKIKLTRDFREFISILNSNDVEYLLVGGYALANYGYVRYTADMDIWVSPTPDNSERVSASLQSFGFSADSVPPEKFQDEKTIFRMGVPPVRIDLLTSVSGLEFPPSYAKKETADSSGIEVNVIALDDLKANKKASGRPKDLGDLDYFSG
ncbi:MAG: hypothetical protein AAGD11_09870 [Planctomycetota bacterium]